MAGSVSLITLARIRETSFELLTKSAKLWLFFGQRNSSKNLFLLRTIVMFLVKDKLVVIISANMNIALIRFSITIANILYCPNGCKQFF